MTTRPARFSLAHRYRKIDIMDSRRDEQAVSGVANGGRHGVGGTFTFESCFVHVLCSDTHVCEFIYMSYMFVSLSEKLKEITWT